MLTCSVQGIVVAEDKQQISQISMSCNPHSDEGGIAEEYRSQSYKILYVLVIELLKVDVSR